MFSRWFLGCALCATFATPAWAVIEVTSDTTIDFDIPDKANSIHVRGDAVLTLDAKPDGTPPIQLSAVVLYDNASVVLRNAWLYGNVHFLGESNRFDLVSGRFRDSNILGDGSGVINIDGNTAYGGEVRFSGGEQTLNFFDFQPAGPVHVYGGPTVHVNAFSQNPVVFMDSNEPLATIVGIRRPGTGGDQGRSIGVQRTTDWTVFANDERPFGDTNSDGVVDLADLNNVRNHFGSRLTSGFWESVGEALPLDGSVDLADLNAVRNSFGQSTAVPEPSSGIMALGCVALAGIASGYRCRRSRSRCP